jgi:hypothetical protein
VQAGDIQLYRCSTRTDDGRTIDTKPRRPDAAVNREPLNPSDRTICRAPTPMQIRRVSCAVILDDEAERVEYAFFVDVRVT